MLHETLTVIHSNYPRNNHSYIYWYSGISKTRYQVNRVGTVYSDHGLISVQMRMAVAAPGRVTGKAFLLRSHTPYIEPAPEGALRQI